MKDIGPGGALELEKIHEKMLAIDNMEQAESKMWDLHKQERKKQLTTGQWGLPKFKENEVIGDEDVEFGKEAIGHIEVLKRNLKALQ
mmetsp:Transcript_24648/g.38321  ORF Transcript_24648/g.38321 Transcript_24648/m.38321 type:complete len:87 (+) Transcript_24648:2253-2513(+)